MPDRATRGGRRLAVLTAVLGATAVVLLVGVLGALAGPDTLFDGDGPVPGRSTPTTAQPTSTDTATPPPPYPARPKGQQTSHGGHLIGVVIRTLLAAVVIGAVLFAIWTWWRGHSPRQRRRREVEIDLDPIDPVAAATQAMLDDADQQQDALRGGSPRNAIVECWHRFELQADTAGVPRHEWETASEFGMRLLDLVAADWFAVSALAELYRAARFSDHDVTEDDRAAAVTALTRIHHSLTAGRTSPR